MRVNSIFWTLPLQRFYPYRLDSYLMDVNVCKFSFIKLSRFPLFFPSPELNQIRENPDRPQVIENQDRPQVIGNEFSGPRSTSFVQRIFIARMVAKQSEGFVFRQRHPHIEFNFLKLLSSRVWRAKEPIHYAQKLQAFTLHIAPIGSGEPRSQFSMPTTKLGDKKYYLGIFFKVSKPIAPSDFVGWLWFQL